METTIANTQPKIKMIMTTRDYADEFNYPIISFFIESLGINLILHSNSFEINKDSIDFSFGTNEELILTKNEVIEIIRNATEISPEDYAKLYNLIHPIMNGSVDLIETLTDQLIYKDIWNKRVSGTENYSEFGQLFVDAKSKNSKYLEEVRMKYSS